MKTSEMVQRLHDMDRLISLQSRYIYTLRNLLGRATETSAIKVDAKEYYLPDSVDFHFTLISGDLIIGQTDPSVNMGEYKTILQLKEKLK